LRVLKDTRNGVAVHPDMWRISPDGKATLIRTYWEDDVGWNKQLGWQPGTWISPNLLTKALAEFARHARGMAERFDNPTTVTCRIEWNGLKDRSVATKRQPVPLHAGHSCSVGLVGAFAFEPLVSVAASFMSAIGIVTL
jgi:hypothetical protein